MTSAISPDHHVDIPASMLESESPPVEPPEVVGATGQGTSEITAEGAGNGQDASEQIPTSSSPPKSTPELEGNQDELPPLKEESGNETTTRIIGSEIPDSDADETSIGDGAKDGDEKIATEDGESRRDGDAVGDQPDGEKGEKDGNDQKDEKDEKKNPLSSPLGTRVVKDTFSASVSTVVDDSSAIITPATTGDAQNLAKIDSNQPTVAPADADRMMAELKTITAPATTGDAQILTKLDSSQFSNAPADADGMMAELKSLKIRSLTARNAILAQEIEAVRSKVEAVTSELKHLPAAETVKKHIKLLHEYNDIRDVGQGLIGMIAENRGVRIGDLYDEFGVGLKD